MEAKVLKSASASAVGFSDGSTLATGPGVFIKLDGQPASWTDLRPGDRCECHEHADGTLAVLKVRRDVPDGCEASKAAGSTDGTDSFKRDTAERGSGQTADLPPADPDLTGPLTNQ